MNLHEQMALDLEEVFFNQDEFACVHEIGGRKIKCILDDVDGMAQTGAASGFANAAAIGILQCDRLVYCQASDLVPQPLPGEKIIMDGHCWLVADAGISETGGLLTLKLNRAY